MGLPGMCLIEKRNGQRSRANKPSVSLARGAQPIYEALLERRRLHRRRHHASGRAVFEFRSARRYYRMFNIGLRFGLLWRMAEANPRERLHMLLPGMTGMPEAVTISSAILSEFLIS
jgi:hypothetical protein